MQINEMACMNLIGAVIKQAINDYNMTVDRYDVLQREYNKLITIRNGLKARKKKLAGINANRLSAVSKMIHDFESSRHFLFGENVLESYLKRFGLEQSINMDYLRNKAKRGIQNEEQTLPIQANKRRIRVIYKTS